MGRRYTPPLWMRHLIPWCVLVWMDKRLSTCWAGMVMWKLGHEGWEWWPSRNCWDGPTDLEYDYCGKYHTKAEIEKAVRR